MLDLIEKMKELWQNERYRSIIILLTYMVFFALVILAFTPRGQLPKIDAPIISDEKDEKNVIDLKDFQYQLKFIDIFENEIEVIVFETGEISIIEESEEDFEIIIKRALVFDIAMIDSLLQKGILVAESINHLENSVEQVYLIEESVFQEILLIDDVTAEIVLTVIDEALEKIKIHFYDDYFEISELEILILDLLID